MTARAERLRPRANPRLRGPSHRGGLSQSLSAAKDQKLEPRREAGVVVLSTAGAQFLRHLLRSKRVINRK